jgi:hypothetical protein
MNDVRRTGARDGRQPLRCSPRVEGRRTLADQAQVGDGRAGCGRRARRAAWAAGRGARRARVRAPPPAPRRRGSGRRVAREAPVDRGAQRGGEPGATRRTRAGRFGGLADEQRGQGRRLEGEPAAHRQVAHHAEGVDVAAPVDRGARGLLRAHEVRGAHELPGIGRGARAPAAVGDAEVGDQRAAGARLQEDVVRLDVAVDDAAAVRVGERPRHLAQHAGGVGRREGPRVRSRSPSVSPST